MKLYDQSRLIFHFMEQTKVDTWYYIFLGNIFDEVLFLNEGESFLEVNFPSVELEDAAP